MEQSKKSPSYWLHLSWKELNFKHWKKVNIGKSLFEWCNCQLSFCKNNDRESAKTEYNIHSLIIFMHTVHTISICLQEMLERQLEYERVRLEAESRKACLESQEKVATHVHVQ